MGTVGFFNRYRIAKVWTQVDFDRAYKFQCVDLMRDFAMQNNYPKITSFGNAIDLWNKWLGDGYTRVKSIPTNYPPTGAFVFWNKSKSRPYGHVAIAGGSNPLVLNVLEQNGWKGSWSWEGDDAIRMKKYSYLWIAGWFIPKM